MAYVKVLQCDECGQRKEQVNHWFALEVDTEDSYTEIVTGSLVCSKMSSLSEEEAETFKHYCGQQCVGKAFQRYLDTGSIEKPVTTHDPDPDFNSSATLIEEKA